MSYQIEAFERYTCDRCGRYVEGVAEHGRSNPEFRESLVREGWLLTDMHVIYDREMCPGCAKTLT